ncbi:MAG TPA: BNR-4 repeat-containing protein [Flavitalea sp.]|nr:BNR-4 repeat-containing protein [Flavitalea sp.]
MGKKTHSGIILFGLLLLICRAVSAQSPAMGGEAYAIAAQDGAWCWFSDPRAVYHKGSRERIYYGYINSRGDVVISARDLQTKAIETYILHERLQVDDHNVPSILFLPDGHILVFYTEHNGRFFMRKSVNPEDILSWEEERTIPFGGTHITYSHPAMLKSENNRIYMFWRGSDWRPSFSFSDDLGETWASAAALIDSNGAYNNRPYLKVSTDNDQRIDFVFSDGHPNREKTNSVYHIYYRKGVFYQTNGEALGRMEDLPIQHTRVNKVYDGAATNIRSWISDIALDKKGNPAIVYTRYPQDDDHRYHYARWDGKKWKDEEICKAGSWITVVRPGEKITEHYYSGGISLDHHDPSNVYLSRQENGVFEVEHWKKKKTSWKRNPLTAQSGMSNLRPYVVAGYTGKHSIVLWMTGLYHHYTDFVTDIRINEPANK